jgi:hypothetical protein
MDSTLEVESIYFSGCAAQEVRREVGCRSRVTIIVIVHHIC